MHSQTSHLQKVRSQASQISTKLLSLGTLIALPIIRHTSSPYHKNTITLFKPHVHCTALPKSFVWRIRKAVIGSHTYVNETEISESDIQRQCDVQKDRKVSIDGMYSCVVVLRSDPAWRPKLSRRFVTYGRSGRCIEPSWAQRINTPSLEYRSISFFLHTCQTYQLFNTKSILPQIYP